MLQTSIAVVVLAQAAAFTAVPVKVTGESFKIILFSDGSVGGWGDMRDGQLGPKDAIPNQSGHATAFVPIQLPGKAIDVAAGARTAYFLLEDRSVMSLGAGFEGQLGCGQPCLKGSETPIAVPGLDNVGRIVAAGHSALAIHQDGGLSQWGSGIQAPQRMQGIPPLAGISIGEGFLLALTRDGSVWQWGKMPFGRVYYDDPVQAPAEVPGLSGSVAAVVATHVAAVLKKDGTVWVWGNNQQAQFGNGKRDVDDRTRVPVRVPGVSNVVALAGAATGRHFMALLRDGTLRAWGNSDWGQIGAGVTGREQASVVTPRLTGVKAVFTAGNNTYAVRDDNTFWIWGGGSAYSREWPMRKDMPFPLQFQIPEGVVAPAAVPAPKPLAPKRF